MTRLGTEELRIADRIIFMHQGGIVETASKDAFFQDPQTQEAKDYIRYHRQG